MSLETVFFGVIAKLVSPIRSWPTPMRRTYLILFPIAFPIHIALFVAICILFVIPLYIVMCISTVVVDIWQGNTP